MTAIEEKLWLENIQLRQQAHYYQSLPARALVKQQEQAGQIMVLKAKLAELQKRLFGRKAERGFSSEAWAAKRRLHRCRGQQRGARGHGRLCRSTLPVEEEVVEASLAQRTCPRCGLPFEAASTPAAHEEIEWEVRLVRKGYRRQCYRRTCACPVGWVNGAGQPKLMSSRVALLRMERAGLVRLPAPQTRNANGRRPSLEATAALALPSPPCTTPVSQLPGLRLDVVETPAEAALYRQKQLHLIVNHSRFLLVPWAGSPNLASCMRVNS